MKKALSDLEHAKKSLEWKSYEWAQFAAEQAAEKALKAVCIEHKTGFTRTHDLTFLARKAGAGGEIIEKCGILNSFYTFSRYPDAAEEMGGKLMQKAALDGINAAEEVIKWCQNQIQTRQ